MYAGERLNRKALQQIEA